MEKDFPATWAYLTECQKDLRGREDGKMDCPAWYGYIYPKNLEVIGRGKNSFPISLRVRPSRLTVKGALHSSVATRLRCSPSTQPTISLILGILNSKPLGDFLKAVSTPLRGGVIAPFRQFMEQLPIKLPTATEDKKLAERITDSVRAIMDAKAALSARLFRQQRGRKVSTLSDGERAASKRLSRQTRNGSTKRCSGSTAWTVCPATSCDLRATARCIIKLLTVKEILYRMHRTDRSECLRISTLDELHSGGPSWPCWTYMPTRFDRLSSTAIRYVALDSFICSRQFSRAAA